MNWSVSNCLEHQRLRVVLGIEIASAAVLDTGAIAVMLSKRNIELADSIRPELWVGVEKLLAERAARRGPARRGRP
jgi:hypothetical protein